MTKSKGIDPAVQALSAIQNAMMILSNRITARGGNLTEALVRLGKGETRYENSLNLIVGELAWVSGADKKVLEITAPLGGHVHIVRVPVDESMDWNVAIDAGFPDTPSSYNARGLGNQYPPRSSGKSVMREIVLVNFGKEISNTRVALLWGKENNLRPESPRGIFAIGKHKPKLHTELGQNALIVASLEECTMFSGSQHVPCGCWRGVLHKVLLVRTDRWWSGPCWFAFEKDSDV